MLASDKAPACDVWWDGELSVEGDDVKPRTGKEDCVDEAETRPFSGVDAWREKADVREENGRNVSCWGRVGATNGDC